MTESLFEWGYRPQVCNFIKKETLAQVFSCEFCEISINTFFIEQLRWMLLSFASQKYDKMILFLAKNATFTNYTKNSTMWTFPKIFFRKIFFSAKKGFRRIVFTWYSWLFCDITRLGKNGFWCNGYYIKNDRFTKFCKIE